jgi:hypothetical protein
MTGLFYALFQGRPQARDEVLAGGGDRGIF